MEKYEPEYLDSYCYLYFHEGKIKVNRELYTDSDVDRWHMRGVVFATEHLANNCADLLNAVINGSPTCVDQHDREPRYFAKKYFNCRDLKDIDRNGYSTHFDKGDGFDDIKIHNGRLLICQGWA